jgi:hypothetical protein
MRHVILVGILLASVVLWTDSVAAQRRTIIQQHRPMFQQPRPTFQYAHSTFQLSATRSLRYRTAPWLQPSNGADDNNAAASPVAMSGLAHRYNWSLGGSGNPGMLNGNGTGH